MMKLLTLTPFVAAVVASSLQLGDVEIFARQNDPITSLVNDITTLTKSVVDLGDTVGGFTGISEAGTVATKAQTVQDNLQTAADNAKKAPTLDNNGALALAVPAQALNEAVVSTLDKITAKKDVFASASLTSVVAQLLEKDNQLAGDYSTALFSKVPAELKSTAMKIVQPSLDKLQKTVDDFKAAAGGSMSSGSSSVMTASAAMSSASSSAAAGMTSMSSMMHSSSMTGTATTKPTASATTTPKASTGAASLNNVLEYGAIVAAAAVAIAAL